MLAKPLIFFLVFVLTIVNFAFIMTPITVLAFPLFIFFKSLFIKAGWNAFYFVVTTLSGIMIIYMLLDLIFGFTVRRINKGCQPIAKATSIIGQKEIIEAFEWLKKKFGVKNVNLYIDPRFNVINAYAVGSFRRKSITLTMGLIQEMQTKSHNMTEYIDAIKGVLGHEMSHLVNNDFLPGMVIHSNSVANREIARVFRYIFIIFSRLLCIVPIIGGTLASLEIQVYNMLIAILNIFYKYIFTPIYNFLKKTFGRSIEYRCDRQSAMAFGGNRMKTALSMLGKGSYFSLFSTHPSTSSRIKKVENITPEAGNINATITDKIANLICIGMVLFVCYYSSSKVDMNEMKTVYMSEVYYPTKSKISIMKTRVMMIYNKYAR